MIKTFSILTHNYMISSGDVVPTRHRELVYSAQRRRSASISLPV